MMTTLSNRGVRSIGGGSWESVEQAWDSIRDSMRKLESRPRDREIQNSLGGLWTTIISSVPVEYLTTVFAPLQAFSRNFSTEVAGGGDGITTRIASAIAAQDTATQGYASIAATSTAVTATLTVNNNVTIGIDDVDNAFAGGPKAFLATFLSPMLEGLATPIWNAIMAQVVASNYPGSDTVAAGSFDAAAAADLASALSVNKCPADNRSLILPPAYFASLVKDSVVTDSSAYGSTDPIRELVIPRVRGFSTFEVSAVPDNSENLAAIALHASAMVCAARVPFAPQSGLTSVSNAVDPNSGMPFQLRSWFSPDLGEHKFAVANLFGCAVGNPTALIRVTSA